ncbi:hypothetical protein FB45DRAFT_879186 [Roridomyces roridus]|uniref:Uncharacterized protein n=1 Tax=Roridomyces roridus TaxID=1738132 RepID=A0AAD7F6U2_9AGAR|nr:hypothetical protein FB45DRAFT_879186 [Roridomyces roridus]
MPNDSDEEKDDVKICNCSPSCSKALTERARRRHYSKGDPLERRPSVTIPRRGRSKRAAETTAGSSDDVDESHGRDSSGDDARTSDDNGDDLSEFQPRGVKQADNIRGTLTLDDFPAVWSTPVVLQATDDARKPGAPKAPKRSSPGCSRLLNDFKAVTPVQKRKRKTEPKEEEAEAEERPKRTSQAGVDYIQERAAEVSQEENNHRTTAHNTKQILLRETSAIALEHSTYCNYSLYKFIGGLNDRECVRVALIKNASPISATVASSRTRLSRKHLPSQRRARRGSTGRKTHIFMLREEDCRAKEHDKGPLEGSGGPPVVEKGRADALESSTARTETHLQLTPARRDDNASDKRIALSWSLCTTKALPGCPRATVLVDAAPVDDKQPSSTAAGVVGGSWDQTVPLLPRGRPLLGLRIPVISAHALHAGHRPFTITSDGTSYSINNLPLKRLSLRTTTKTCNKCPPQSSHSRSCAPRASYRYRPSARLPPDDEYGSITTRRGNLSWNPAQLAICYLATSVLSLLFIVQPQLYKRWTQDSKSIEARDVVNTCSVSSCFHRPHSFARAPTCAYLSPRPCAVFWKLILSDLSTFEGRHPVNVDFLAATVTLPLQPHATATADSFFRRARLVPRQPFISSPLRYCKTLDSVTRTRMYPCSR